jgi:hypothetical protein
MTDLIQLFANRRAAVIAACGTCRGSGSVVLEAGDIPCPTCRFSDCRAFIYGDQQEAILEWLDFPERALSPSEIESWVLCHRRWGWERLDGIRRPSSEAAELGTRVHAQLERWFRAGILPDPNLPEGKIAESGLHMWPAPDNVTEIELHIGTQTAASRYHGYQDIGYPEPVSPVVGDHKTTGDLKWAKTAEDLQTDIQAMIYAKAAMDRHGVDRVKLRWGYLRTKGARKAHLVEAIVDRQTVEKVFAEKIDPYAREIHAAQASGLTGIDMEIDATACDAFGGCPHRDRCNLTPTQRLESLMAQEELRNEKALTLKEIMQAKNAAKGINPPESALPPAPAVVPVASAVIAPADLAARIAARASGKAPAEAAAPVVAPVAGPVAGNAFTRRAAVANSTSVPAPIAAPAVAAPAPPVVATPIAAATPSAPGNAFAALMAKKNGTPVPVAAPAQTALATLLATKVEIPPITFTPVNGAPVVISREALLAEADKLDAMVTAGIGKDLAEAVAAVPISEGLATRLAEAGQAATTAPVPRTRKARDQAMAVNADVHTAIAAVTSPSTAAISITLQCLHCQESHSTSATAVSHIELFTQLHKDCGK